MLRRWGHGHSLGAGGLIGIAAVSYRVWLLLAAAFLLGMVAEWFRRTAATLADHFLWKRKRKLTASKGVAVERVSAQTDEIPWH